MYVALTGTPGTGKSSVSACLIKKKIPVIDLYKLACEHDFFQGMDEQRNSKILDMQKIHSFLQKQISPQKTTLIEGHASHLLPLINKCIILRCHPQVLKNRLQKKQWPTKKINENLEAETLDVILCEAAERFNEKDLFEIDTTMKTIDEIASSIANLYVHEFRFIRDYKIGQIDWSEEILKDL